MRPHSRFRSRGFLPALALLAASVSSCQCREAPSSPPEGARRVPTTTPAEASAPPAKPAPPGSPRQPLRLVEHAVYMAAPVPAAQLDRAKREARARFPDVPIVSEPKEPPGVMIGAPDIATYAPPGEDSLVFSGRGLSPEAAKAAAASMGALRLSFAFDDDPKLARLRATQALVADLAEKAGGFVWDQATREVYSVAAFRAARIETWQGDVPDVQRHFTIHYYATGDGRHRAITLGLEKLGLPDLVIQDVPQRSSTPASSLMNVLAQLLVEGAAIGPGGRIVVDSTSIAHAGARERASSNLLGKPARRATVEIGRASCRERVFVGV